MPNWAKSMALGLTSASRGTGGRKKRRKKATTKRRRTTKRRIGGGTNAAGKRFLRKSGIPRQRGPAYDTEGMLVRRKKRRTKRGSRLVKGSPEAKRRMAQLRRMRRR